MTIYFDVATVYYQIEVSVECVVSSSRRDANVLAVQVCEQPDKTIFSSALIEIFSDITMGSAMEPFTPSGVIFPIRCYSKTLGHIFESESGEIIYAQSRLSGNTHIRCFSL